MLIINIFILLQDKLLLLLFLCFIILSGPIFFVRLSFPQAGLSGAAQELVYAGLHT